MSVLTNTYTCEDCIECYCFPFFDFLMLTFLQLLSSSLELISHQPSPFANLKILHVYPKLISLNEKGTISSEVKNYLLDSSPGVTFTMVLREVLH